MFKQNSLIKLFCVFIFFSSHDLSCTSNDASIMLQEEEVPQRHIKKTASTRNNVIKPLGMGAMLGVLGTLAVLRLEGSADTQQNCPSCPPCPLYSMPSNWTQENDETSEFAQSATILHGNETLEEKRQRLTKIFDYLTRESLNRTLFATYQARKLEQQDRQKRQTISKQSKERYKRKK